MLLGSLIEMMGEARLRLRLRLRGRTLLLTDMDDMLLLLLLDEMHMITAPTTISTNTGRPMAALLREVPAVGDDKEEEAIVQFEVKVSCSNGFI
jgi:hypothetical protein